MDREQKDRLKRAAIASLFLLAAYLVFRPRGGPRGAA